MTPGPSQGSGFFLSDGAVPSLPMATRTLTRRMARAC